MTQRHRVSGHVKMEAEVAVVMPEVRERPEAGSGKNAPLEPLERPWPCQHLDFGLLPSRKVGK